MATDIVEVVSGKRNSPHSRKHQVSQRWLKRDQSSSTEEQYATQGGTPPVLRNGRSQVRLGSFRGRPGRQGKQRHGMNDLLKYSQSTTYVQYTTLVSKPVPYIMDGKSFVDLQLNIPRRRLSLRYRAENWQRANIITIGLTKVGRRRAFDVAVFGATATVTGS
jgi:hypothetical protein